MNPESSTLSAMRGRGTTYNPQIRFEALRWEAFDDEWAHVEDSFGEERERRIPTQYFRDNTKTALARNSSPDIGFTYDLNPYRGCEHGCIYCYARPTHEYLGFSSGLDFETKIMVKENIAALLEKEFQKPSWKPQVVMLSGNTDCYQPIERRLQLTRKCLEVFLKYRNPVGMITKNALVLRDVDLLSELARLNLVSVTLSVTTLDRNLGRKMEPRTSSPEHRLMAIEGLAKAGVRVGVNVAPVIPGLNDEEIPAILSAAKERGATGAGFTVVRLPYAVKDLFVEWIKREFPERAERVLHRIREVRSGNLNDPNFGSRMRGNGEIAETIAQLFKVAKRKLGFNKPHEPLSTSQFRVLTNQFELFEMQL
ncbi:MAG: PA0069 family radical SAM protein [Bacteroidota bacterium]|nr:PA0069 family radical SAM protein [Bacteroidota bacterium]